MHSDWRAQIIEGCNK
ncbi:hypothetical protein ACJJIU_11695 [Microbulbifer sp. CnH-101-E]